MRKSADIKALREAAGLADRAKAEPGFISSLVRTLGEKGAARFEAAKKLQLISRAEPSLLYPYFDTLSGLLDSTSSVLLWNAIIILSYLVSVDAEKRFDGIFSSYYGHLRDGKLVTAANILGSSGRIAASRPDLAGKITAQILQVDDIPLPTLECREVARGAALSAFVEYTGSLKNEQAVLQFAARCAGSHRPTVKKKAGELLEQLKQ